MRVGRGLRAALVDGDDSVSTQAQADAFARFQGALKRDAKKQQQRRYAIGAAAVLGLFTVVGYSVWPDPALTFKASAEASSGYIRVGANDPAATVDFSDGTQILLHPESQARIAEVTAHGARLALEGGSVHLKVKPLEGAKWAVEAGPYRIRVTGTEFDVKWRTSHDVLEVVLQEGSVEVQGPLTSSGIRVAAGERLVADLRTSEVRLASAAAERESSEPEATEPERAEVEPADAPDVAPPEPRLKVSSPPVERRAVAPARTDWSTLMKASKYREIVADAKAQGLDTALGSVSLGELSMLADAARYSGQARIASRALLAERQRFSGSKQARSAAFMLGRLAEDHLGDARTALTWYTTYLQESPSGAFASEALGRKMGLVKRTRGRSAAESLARSYLERYPKGPYATAARRILSP